MILGLTAASPANCFVEIDEAVRQLRGRDDVYFNAHVFDAPEGGVVFNLENVPGQVDPARWESRHVWDFSASNAAKYDAEHVPVGWHASMERFARSAELDIDVVFTGCLNPRRIRVLEALADRDLNVVVIPPGVYGTERDAVLARAKLALNMLFYEDGIFPALRVAHLVANRVPVLSERCPEGWGFVPTCDYSEIVDAAERRVRSRVSAEDNACFSYERFRQMPMVLP
jgi:hypothetical protein